MKKLFIIFSLLQVALSSRGQVLALDTTDNFCIGAEQTIYMFDDWSRPRIFDFDNDGDKDFAILEDYADSLAIYINNGTADFTVTPSYKISTTWNLVDLAVSDLDADGFIDIVTISDNGDLYFYKNNAGVSLTQVSTLANTIMPNLSAHKIEIHDFNNDGLVDILGSGEDYVLGTFHAFTFQQTGTFTFSQMSAMPVFSGHIAQFNLPKTTFAFADFDADGFQDFAIGCEDITDTIEVYKNAGTTTSISFIATPFSFTNSATGYTEYIKAGDYTGDGMADISVASSSGFSIHRNMGSAMTFTPFITDPSIFCKQFDFADMNSDNMKDLVTCDYGSYHIYPGVSTSQVSFLSGFYNYFNLYDRRQFGLADLDANSTPDFLFIGMGDVPYLQVSRNFTFHLKNTIVSTNTLICGSTPVTFSVSNSHPSYPGNYDWTPGPATGTLYTAAAAGSVSCAFSYTLPPGMGQCTIYSDTILVNSQVTPTAAINATMSAINCSGASIPLEVNVTGSTTYTWSTGQTTSSIVVTPTTTATYTVFLDNGCPGSETITVNITSNPTVYITAPSTSICAGDSLVLTANGGGAYTWYPSSATTTSITIKPTATSDYTVVGYNSFGCSDTTNTTITVNTLPAVNIAPSKSLICFPDTVTLTASGASSYTWSTGANSSTLPVIALVNTTYSVTGSNGCIASAIFTLNGFSRPTITATSSKPNVCNGDSVTLKAYGAGSYTWAPGFQIGNSIYDFPGGPTTYSVLGVNSFGCYNYTTVSVGFNNPPAITIASSELCVGKPATITAVGAISYTWDNGSTSSAIGVTPVNQTPLSFTVDAVDATGCKSTATQTFPISDQCTLIVWNGVTPNGDGHNDFFRIENIEQYPGNQVLIFNRWGQKLADIDDYNNTNKFWSGNAVGDNLVPSGTYYYVIDLKNGSEPLKGYIELTKKDLN